jgi:hypothetical protein
MNVQALLIMHTLPLWFLALALFLPRIALLLLWLQTSLVPFNVHGIVPLIVAIILPRLLVLYLIYLDQGIGLWFLIHLVVAVLVWSGSGRYHSRRWRRRGDY